jgi:hypothetical protein
MRESLCPSKERLPGIPPGPRIRFSAAWCLMSRATPASTAVPPCPQAIFTGGARLSRNQARSSTDCSHPRRTDGQIKRGLPRKFRVGKSIASCSWAVTYGSNARLLLAPTRGVNQAGREGYPMVQGGRISALNSARWSERVPRWKRRPAATGCCDWHSECRGDWIRTSDLLNPIKTVYRPKLPESA